MKAGSVRGWHSWVSIILLVPMFIVGATAIFIAHEKALGTDEVELSPSLAGNAYRAEGREIIVRDVHVGQTDTLVASQAGLFRLAGEDLTRVAGVPNGEFRSVAAQPDGTLLAAGKYGLWRQPANGPWAMLSDGDYHSVAVTAGGIVAYLKDTGMQISRDGGRTWSADPAFARLASVAGEQAEPYTMQKLVMDLHTGKFFFGKQAEWIWIDLLGITLVMLCLTGGLMWWRSQKRKSQEA